MAKECPKGVPRDEYFVAIAIRLLHTKRRDVRPTHANIDQLVYDMMIWDQENP